MTATSRAKRSAVRIIGGEWRGRRLEFPGGTDVRPTPDRVRETLFNWLRDHVVGARCLDLYAGTGALGFEALSRGAREAVMIERDRRLIDALERQKEALGANATIVRSDAASFLAAASGGLFDIIFVDPPFDEPVEPLLADLLGRLADRGRLYIERSRSDGLPRSAMLEWLKTGHAGRACFGLAARRRENDAGVGTQLQ
jgi:16S rRNA (guanine966-N2)-methyltransferase